MFVDSFNSPSKRGSTEFDDDDAKLDSVLKKTAKAECYLVQGTRSLGRGCKAAVLNLKLALKSDEDQEPFQILNRKEFDKWKANLPSET